MKDQKLKKLIQKPLRFHHQDIHDELDGIKSILSDLVYHVIELKKEIKDQRCKTKKCPTCGTGTSDLTSE